MHITELRIRNFRNFLNAKFCFSEGLNTLIGENGSGKTNVLQALRIILDESLERNATYLRESDFCRDLQSWKGEWIVISAQFAELDPSEGCQLLKHHTGHMDRTNTGTCTYLFRPKREARKKLFELSGNVEEIQEFLRTLNINDYEPCFTARGTGSLLDDAVYRTWVGNPETGEYPDPEKDDENILGVRVRAVYEEVACTFVRALRDVVSELRGYRSSPLLTLLRGMESAIEIVEADRITGQVQALNSDISSLKEIKDLATGIEGALKKAVGYTYGPSVTIESALPDSMERLLQRLIVLVGDSSASEYRGELQEQSLGAANLIYLALKLLEYELKLSTDRVAHFFLIEEPEAHIHTHIQKTLFSNLPSKKTQVIVSTHSTHISSAAKIASVNILAKKDDHVEVYQPANGLSSIEVTRLERYLDAVRSTLLFAKGVLLVEGDTEQVMIAALLKEAFGCSTDELGFSVISMSAAFFEHVAVIFAADRMHRPCAIVTDKDTALINLPADATTDNAEEAHARAAQLSGERRAAALETTIGENPWVKAFFADHTFEIDFLLAGNALEVKGALPQIYTSQVALKNSEELLDSKDNVVAGREILRLAEKVGKGWFALLISETLDVQTFIPNYILSAIAFACHLSINAGALRRIAEYRVQRAEEGVGIYATELMPLARTTGVPAEEYLANYRQLAPSDDFSTFCQLIEEFRRS
jgi:putative ATP-dependent endonuclease of the OLD family